MSLTRKFILLAGTAALVLAGTVALVVAFVSAAEGRNREALSALLICSGAYLLALWPWTSSVRVSWFGVALIAGGFATAGHVVFALVAVVVLVVMVLVSIVLTRRLLRGFGKIEFEAVGPDAVMPEAERTVAEFEAGGFRRVGGYRTPIGEQLVVVTVLVGPDADRFAGVTDGVVEVVSRFEGRFFVTINRASLPVPGDFLRQDIADDETEWLIAAHQTAIELLARSGARPDRFDADTDVAEAARAVDERTIRFLSDAPLRRVLRLSVLRKAQEPVLGSDRRSRRRIESWLDAEPSA